MPAHLLEFVVTFQMSSRSRQSSETSCKIFLQNLKYFLGKRRYLFYKIAVPSVGRHLLILPSTFMDGAMSNQPRAVKVFAALLASMTAGAILLMVLGNNPPSAGPFCLSSYYRLDSVEKAVLSQGPQTPGRWNCIEVYYSDTKAGNIEQLASLNGLAGPEEINCHFVICNGLGGGDGQILPTEKWQRQWSIVPGRTWYGTSQTIRVCVVADGKTNPPTNYQKKRIDTLVERLCRKFDIHPEHVYYPSDWQ